MAKNKHLTDVERLQIEQWLRGGISLKQIAAKLDKSASTISREVRAHAIESNKYAPHRAHNRCTNRSICKRRQICADRPNCTKHCAACSYCNAVCEQYEEQICHKLYEPPYVCNGCLEERQCVLKKKYYLHGQAQQAYREMLVECRSGANITESELLGYSHSTRPEIRMTLGSHLAA